MRGRRGLSVGYFFLLPVLVGGILILNTVRFSNEPVLVKKVPPVEIDGAAAAQRLARLIRFPTVSNRDPAKIDSAAFLGLIDYLELAYPRVHASLKRELVSDFSLLYTWQGRRSELLPVLLLAHYDVVPPGDEAWRHPPFGGVVAEGSVWGRGAIDHKSGVAALFEACEMLLGERFTPERTVYLAVGHDEETGGLRGASEVARILHDRGVRLEVVLDEGGFIVDDIIDGLTAPVAGVGVAEKGYLSLELTAEGRGGHSSVPPRHTAVGRLSRAITALEDQPFPARIDEPTRSLLERIGPSLPLTRRLALANLWLFEPVVARTLGAKPESSAMVRTTTAATMMSGSDRDNVLPSSARAVVNFRLFPGDTRDDVTERVIEIIDDPGVTVKRLPGSSEPSTVSGTDAPGYRILERSILEVSPEEDLIVAPFLVMGATDSRYFASLTNTTYRYNGARVSMDVLRGYHGVDEHLPVDEYVRMIGTYYRFLINLDEM